MLKISSSEAKKWDIKLFSEEKMCIHAIPLFLGPCFSCNNDELDKLYFESQSALYRNFVQKKL